MAESPANLPVGWTEQIVYENGQEIKFYYNVITRQKFYSKADLLRCVELGVPSQGTRLQKRAQNEGNTENRLMLMPPETNKTPEWLPPGWIMEVNAMSNGKKYKTYIDPLNGRRFPSKPAIMRYLISEKGYDPAAFELTANTGSDSNPRTGESSGAETPLKLKGSQTRKRTSSTSSQKPKSSSDSQQKKFEIVRYKAEGLPPGWMKEIKIEGTGSKIRKDPYFTDPETTYVFRSHRDALRYLETKDLRACLSKPRKREELKFLCDDTSISREKQILDNTTEECGEKEEIRSPTSSQPPKTPGSKRKRGRPLASPSNDNVMRQGKAAEIIFDSTKSEGEKGIIVEASARDDGVIMEEKDGDNNLEQQPLDRLECDSFVDPCLEFSYKTLRGDFPVEANNLASQSYNHQQRDSINVGNPSFSDYAGR